MNLVRLSYASEATRDISDEELGEILTIAKKNNSPLGLTGYLFYQNKYFLQVLEGKRESVSRIYHKISQDDRHENLVILGCSPIAKRLFSNWSMGMSLNFVARQELCLEYSPSSIFNPFTFSDESTGLFLSEIANAIEKNA